MGNGGVQKIQDTGNVYFAPGLVKSVKIEKESVWANHAYQGKENLYSVKLNDGTRLRYAKQMGTNQSRVETNGKTIIFKGIDGIVVHETLNNDKYEFQGCRGYVNVYDGNSAQDFDSVTSKNRKFKNGSMQESRLYIIKDKNVKLKITSNDFIDDIWSKRQAEKRATQKNNK